MRATDAAGDPDGTVKEPATPDTNDTPKRNTLQSAPGVVDPNTVGIHREPGLFLHLANSVGPCGNQSQPGPDLARIASIPHGDAVMAMGFGGNADPTPVPPDFTLPAIVEAFSGLPIGFATNDIDNGYFGPYKHFHLNPFKGNVDPATAPTFPGFDPTIPLNLLNGAIEGALPGSKVTETTTFTVDTDVQGAITNIPFVQCQAQAARVTATFWIQRVQFGGRERFVLQYAQRVLLEFFPRSDGTPGLVQWPHISINSMIRKLP